MEFSLEVCLKVFAMVSWIGLMIYLFYPALVAKNSGKLHQQKTAPITIQEPPNAQKNRPLLTLVIPAYNEEDRLPNMLEQAHCYLANATNTPVALACLAARCNKQQQQPRTTTIEWIVVSDGSTDRTSDVYRSYIKQHSQNSNGTNMIWKLIAFPSNQGKGAAVRAGMLAATADYCLMVDADGATEFGPGLEALIASEHAAVVWGSRVPDTADRSIVRWILTTVFHWCVVIFVGTGEIRDTQCGFKLLTHDAARELFGSLHLQRWAFDTEMLFLASQLKYSMVEVVVPWKEVEGSKLHTSALNLVLVSLGMLRDMVCVRLCYTLGLWKIRRKRD